jgi:RNA polymerase sigma factor (sigma-70 family)
MRNPAGADPELATILAARGGNRAALDALAAAYLPLVYNIVGRALNGHADVDDVVQETMLRAVRGLGELRDPAAFRSWLVAIAVRQVRDSYRARLARPPAVESPVMESAVPVPDFAGQTIERLGLSGQRRQVAEASRWLDDDDQPVLALWWQEAAGQLGRAGLAAGLGTTTAHAAVRVQRMKERLATSRMVVQALRHVPPCAALTVVTAGWDGEPSPLWRKRLARHIRDCPWCGAGTADLVPAERLLAGLPLLAVPAGLAGRVLRPVASGLFGRPPVRPAARRAVRAAHHGRLLAKTAVSVQPKLVAVSLAVLTCTAGGTFAVARAHRPAGPSVTSRAPAAPSVAALRPVPLVTGSAHLKQPAQTPFPPATKAPATKAPAKPVPVKPAPAAVTSQRKGVSAWNFTGVQQALADSGASWYYNWGTAPDGIAAPADVGYVPMIWGAASVTTANLAAVKQEGNVLLGFNEPDMAGQANLTVTQALDLWPQLMATGMTLGSPAVASGAAAPGGWLDQFMTGAKARGYRVDFITVHWYGADFSTGPAVQQLESYLQAIYARYHLPV